MEENRIPKKVLYMNLEATRLKGKPRNRWQESEGGWQISWWKRVEGEGI
jgi:hypothetical protein